MNKQYKHFEFENIDSKFEPENDSALSKIIIAILGFALIALVFWLGIEELCK